MKNQKAKAPAAKTKKSVLNEKAWVKQVLKAYDAVEARQPKISRHDFDWPDWVFKLLLILMKVSHPGLDLKNSNKWRARDLGYFLGRQSAGESLVFGEVPLTAQVQQEHLKNTELMLQARGFNNEKFAKVLTKYGVGMIKWRRHFQRFLAKTLAEARLRPYKEKSAFFAAFGKANVYEAKDFDTDAKIGVGERIAGVMFLFREHIATFEKIPQLHQFLQKAAEPHGIQIGLKRVEALCRRIGLKFKAERGRPKGKNPKNSTAVT